MLPINAFRHGHNIYCRLKIVYEGNTPQTSNKTKFITTCTKRGQSSFLGGICEWVSEWVGTSWGTRKSEKVGAFAKRDQTHPRYWIKQRLVGFFANSQLPESCTLGAVLVHWSRIRYESRLTPHSKKESSQAPRTRNHLLKIWLNVSLLYLLSSCSFFRRGRKSCTRQCATQNPMRKPMYKFRGLVLFYSWVFPFAGLVHRYVYILVYFCFKYFMFSLVFSFNSLSTHLSGYMCMSCL